MFRLWGKEFKDNRMLKDSMLWTRSVMSSTSANRSGWIIILMNSKDMTRQDSIRITLWIPLILIIWRFILLKNKLCINNKKEVRRPPFTEGLPDFFLMFYSFLIAASGLSFIARFAGKYPASTPTSTANTMDISTSHHGI